jgi:PEP-CTERM motif
MIRALALAFFVSAGLWAGPLTIGFSSSLLNAAPGQTVTFNATVANPSAAAVSLDSDALNVTAPLTGNDTKFFLNFPVSLAAGQSVTAPIFDIFVPAGTAFGVYPGRFDIVSTRAGTVGSADFAVSVVPEPGAVGLMALGLMTIFTVRRRPGSAETLRRVRV